MQKEIHFSQLAQADYIRGLQSLSKLLRVGTLGGSLNFKPFLRLLCRANAEISVKKKKGEALSEHEKWLSDNLYLVKRANQKYSAKQLPLLVTDGELRIVTFLRYALCNKKNLQKEDIVETICIVNSETNLSFDEMKALPNAFSYVLVEGLSVIADRILYHNKMKYLAEREDADERYFVSDIYNYYLLKYTKNREKTREMLVAKGVNLQSAEAAFTINTMENDEIARKFLSLLQQIDEITALTATVPTLETYKVLSTVKGYKKMSFDTELYYLSFVSNIAKLEKMSEVAVAEKLVSFAKEADYEMGEIVFYREKAFRYFLKSNKISKKKAKEVPIKEVIYFLSSLTLGAALTALICLVLRSYLPILLFLPLCFVVEQIFNNALKATSKHRFLPRMNFLQVPMNCKTLVAVSEFIVSLPQLKEAVHHLKVLRAGNGGQNVEFALLIDLKSTETEEADDDVAFLEYLKSALVNEDGLNAFVRKRTQDGKNFSGRERKRGAIEEMNFMLTSGNTSHFRLVVKECQTPQYVVLLDSDNAVEPGGILDMVNLISHPANERYDLLTATGRYRLNVVSTLYSQRFQSLGGLESYPHYSSFFFDMFGKDVFCGKGIYRLKAYEKKIAGIFPEKKILSHDIIEGAVLNTASGGVVYEDAPDTFLQEEERITRWQRGDIQLLPFIFRTWKNNKKEKYRSEIPFFYRALIVRNVFNILSPVVLFAAIIAGLFSFPAVSLAAAIVFWLPFVIDFVGEIHTVFEGRRLKYVLKGICLSFYLTLEKFLLLPYRALKNLSVFCVTLGKMFLKKNLLEWKTFYMSRKENKVSVLFKMTAAPLLLCTIVLAIMFLLENAAIFSFAAYTVLMLAALATLAILSKEPVEKCVKNKQFLNNIAEKTFRYFDFIRTENELPTDNFQERPFKGRAKTTSPTNIGYAILADICAFYLGYRGKDITLAHLQNSVSVVEKLKKWKGNLYNWYATGGEPANKFISGVDSGNFVVCLMELQGFLTEINEDKLCARVTKLIDETELSALCDKEKKLFYLGYDAKSKKYVGHYDMLMSESRLTAFLQVAQSKDSALWRNLSRDYTGRMGNTLLSWSGTMFEYLMPALFLRSPKGSLIAKSEKNAIKIQRQTKFRGVWGRSEGGYHAFDNEMNYLYYAVGEEKLSLRNEINRTVVSPYSSALALVYSEYFAVKNLKKLAKIGLMGEYGFYEGIDFSEGKKQIVKSYMTHHQGMVLAALTNKLKGDILVRLMQKNPRIVCAELVLTEKTSEKWYSNKMPKIQPIIAKNSIEYYVKTTNQEYCEKILALTNGKISVFYDNLGNNQIACGKILVGKPYNTDGKPVGSFFYVEDGGVFRAPTAMPLKNNCEYESGQTEHKLFFTNITAGLTLEIIKNDNFEAVTKRLTVRAATGKQVSLAYICELTMNEADAYLSHPTFNGMFVSTAYIPEKKTIIAEKRVGAEIGDRFMALIIKGMDKIRVETDRSRIIGRGNTLSNPKILSEMDSAEWGVDGGDVLEPAFGFSGVTELSREGAATVEVTEVFSASKEELLKILDTMPHDFFSYAEKSQGENFYADSFTSELISRLCVSKRNTEKILSESAVDTHLFHNYNRGGLGVLYIAGSSVLHIKTLIRALKCAAYLGIKTHLTVYLQKSADERLLRKFKETFETELFQDYHFISEETEQNKAETYCFLHLTETLEFGEKILPTSTLSRIKLSSERALPLERESFLQAGKNGGFLENGDFLLTGMPDLPFSNVIAMANGGFIATENGGGYAFFGNSRENKLNDFANDPVEDGASEALFAGVKTFFRINCGRSGTRYTPGKITYYNHYTGFTSRTEAYMIRTGKIRVFESDIETNENNWKLIYSLKPALDWKRDANNLVFAGEEGLLRIQNLKTGTKAYIKIISPNLLSVKIAEQSENTPYLIAEMATNGGKTFVVISDSKSELSELTEEAILSEKMVSQKYFEGLNPVTLKTSDLALDILFNRWLMPQTVSSRLNARAGYYQAGGAIGFRDQLQDVLSLLNFEPERVREQIILSARHQYSEGDVQHWWHPPKFGIRTKISDDKLFLVLVTAKYLRATGDKSILAEEISYLVSEPLKEHELNRFENPKESAEKASLLKHCFAALKSALRYGEHGLLLMGAGDWNDGMDAVGQKMKGESVVTSMLFVWAVREFSDFVEDSALRIELLKISKQLQDALNRHAYRDGQYLRLFSDDGKWYGAGVGALKIDLVSESLAVLSGTADRARAESALKAASVLVDKENSIVRLLSPALGKTCYLGYISKYPRGVRENGGQYTHGVIWYLLALVSVGRQNEAYELFCMINPVAKYQNSEVYEKYKGEPFVLSGDVYSSPRNPGRMGWSWYTGSASWCYIFILEGLFGVKRLGNELEITPHLPDKLDGAELMYHYKNSEYKIVFCKKGKRKLIYQGVALQTDSKIPLQENRRAEILVEF